MHQLAPHASLVRAWAKEYENDGLVVLGVHTPEFPFEQDLDNVRRAVEDMEIEYPVALDSDYAIWDAFANRYWPALYFVDREGAIRDHHFGEGRYEQSERVIQRLLGRRPRARRGRRQRRRSCGRLGRPRLPGDLRRRRRAPSAARTTRPPRCGATTGRSSGDWTTRAQGAVLNEPGGGIAFRFHARDLHLVLRAGAGPVRFRVTLDGERAR